MSCRRSSIFRLLLLCDAASLRRRPDQVRAAAGSCRQMRLADAWRIPLAGGFQHTLSRSCCKLWPRPPFELALSFAKVREGSYPNEPHLRVPPSISMVPCVVADATLCRRASWHPLNSAIAHTFCTTPPSRCAGRSLSWVACVRTSSSACVLLDGGGVVGAMLVVHVGARAW